MKNSLFKLLFISAIFINSSLSYANSNFNSNFHLNIFTNIEYSYIIQNNMVNITFYKILSDVVLGTKVDYEVNNKKSLSNVVGLIAGSGGLLAPVIFFPDVYVNKSLSGDDLTVLGITDVSKEPVTKMNVEIVLNAIEYGIFCTDNSGRISFPFEEGVLGILGIDDCTGLSVNDEFFITNLK